MLRTEKTRTAARLPGRSRLIMLSLLAVLGVLVMHGTPAMAMPTGSHGASSAAAGTMSSAPVMSTGSSATQHRMAGEGVAAARAGQQVSAVPAGGHGSHVPAEHHMLVPCLSDTARAVHVVLPLTGSSVTGLPVVLRAQVVDRTVSPSEPFAEPPDLQKLCISRT